MATRRPLFKSAYGSVRLWLSRVSTSGGRSVIVQQFTTGNVPDVRDRGDDTHTTSCAILFDEMTGDDFDPIDRLEALLALKATGKPQLFVHPIHGTYLAQLVGLEHEVDETGTISGSATFVALEEPGGNGGAVTAGADAFGVVSVRPDTNVDSVDVRGKDLQSLFDTLGDGSLSSVALAAIKSQVRGADDFLADASRARKILVDVSSASDQLWDEIDTLRLATDVALWPVMKAYVMLGDAVRGAADREMGDEGAYMTVRVGSPVSLRRLVSDIYGASQAEVRYDEARGLNDIRTPARIPTGTELRLRQPGS